MSAMNIVVFSSQAGSPRHGMVLRTFRYAEEWVRQGHDVTIVAASYVHNRHVQPRCLGGSSIEYIRNVRYVWLRTPRYDPGKQVGRVANMFAYTLRALWAPLSLEGVPDLVVASSPHPFSIYPARKYAREFGACLVFDVRDLWPLTLMELGNLSSRNPFIRLVQSAENFAYSVADLVTAVAQHADPYMREHGLPAGRFLHLPNAVRYDRDEFLPLPSLHLEALRNLESGDNFLLGYCGAIGVTNAMEIVVKALASLGDRRVHLVIVGQGQREDDLLREARRIGVGRQVHVLPPLETQRVNAFLTRMHAVYAGGHKTKLYQYGAGLTKLGDYMFASKPVIYAIGDPGNGVVASCCGISCEPGNIEEIAKAIGKLRDMTPSQRAQMGMRGRSWFEENRDISVLAVGMLEQAMLRRGRVTKGRVLPTRP